MANEGKKDFNAMLMDSKDMPKVQTITDQKSIKKYGGDKMYFAPPIDYDKVMRDCCLAFQGNGRLVLFPGARMQRRPSTMRWFLKRLPRWHIEPS